MYLKSIEVQGFKSFANKIVFQFHNGITGIVGPNGSGKSNVADAVRWVLGEQRVKQLRGGSMQDVIFSGTESRKPLSYASVAITLDNSDHQLPTSYDEVTVTRRLYRSGESEYMLNGTQCRLKDVNELFYDTGIGKEGYSIIGQGQIEKILNGKPEERRELFDEAAGIVKFKRRKLTAQKKLEDEKQNLIRVNDILSELTKQLGPLERQSQTARVYLQKKEELKRYEVNQFLSEVGTMKKAAEELEEKEKLAAGELEQATAEYEQTKTEYEELQAGIEQLDTRLLSGRDEVSRLAITRQQLTSQVELLREQIKSAGANEEYLNSRIAAIEREQEERGKQREENEGEKEELLRQLGEILDQEKAARADSEEIQAKLDELNSRIEQGKNAIIQLLNQRASTKAKLQRYDTMEEQIAIRRAQISQQVLRLKSEESRQKIERGRAQASLDQITAKIHELMEENDQTGAELDQVQEQLTGLNQQMEQEQAGYHREASRLESLKNIAERYDGYGNSIRRVMEQKNREPGLLGVVADLIKVDKRYETAIEIALGGNIQNIVTDNEGTAKRMIQFLKVNKFGRATFLPLTSMKGGGKFSQPAALKEKGVIGLANTLVRAESRFDSLLEQLLGRTVVADTIDNALALAARYHHSLRIVTLEGELLNPGGSLSGGAFKNSSNLLGRRREIEELTAQVAEQKKNLESRQREIDETRLRRNGLRDRIVSLKDQLQEEYLLENTAKMKLDELSSKEEDATSGYQRLSRESREMDSQIQDIRKDQEEIQAELDLSEKQENELQEQIKAAQAGLEEQKKVQDDHAQAFEDVHVRLAALRQKEEFLKQNMARLAQEAENLEAEKTEIAGNLLESQSQRERKAAEITAIQEEIAETGEQESRARQEIAGHEEKKEALSAKQKTFFAKREELSGRMNLLDKEVFRLRAQLEKLEEGKEAQINYMWEEYELTYPLAQALYDPALEEEGPLKKHIGELKGEIKRLGNVNVNAIEEYKEVSERHAFLSAQHEDLIKAEQALMDIIRELDEGMRAQFKEQFARIQTEFDKAFRELFGGGKGTLELVEDEDILEAGVRIIAQPPGKKLVNMMQMSGGEKSLTAIALLFAIQNLKPSPFCLLDEIEAALDENNVTRYANYLHKLTKNTQFIIITHRRGTMEAADRLYGITMQEKGVSALVSVNLIEGELDQ